MPRSSSQFWFFSVVGLMLLSSCGEKKVTNFKSEPMEASGDFLFAGPNTLQGAFTLSTEEMAEAAGTKVAEVKEVKVGGISLSFVDDSLRSNAESVLVQLVSNELPLQTIGTLSPLSSDPVQQLQVNQDLDVLPYLKDNTTQLVVDTNLSSDLDELTVSVVFEFSIIQ